VGEGGYNERGDEGNKRDKTHRKPVSSVDARKRVKARPLCSLYAVL